MVSRKGAVAAGVTLTLLVAACGGSDSKTDSGGTTGDTFKIGYAADLSEIGGIGDNPGTSGAQFMVDQLNKAGGVCGKQIELVVKEISQTPPDPVAAKRGVRELIDGGAEVLLGPPFSDYGFPILDETGGKLPVLFVTSTEVSLTDISRGSFLVSFNDYVQSSAAAEFATKQGWKIAVTLSSSDIPYLTVNPQGFTEVFEKAGGTVASDLTYSLGATDFSAQVNEIAAMSPQPDIIYSSFFLPEAGVFLTQLREAGVKSAVFGADGFEASFIWTEAAAEGVYFTSHTFPSADNDVQKFLDDHAKSGLPKIETPSFGVLGADAVQLAVAAKGKNCDGDPASLIKTLSDLENVKVTSGTDTYKGTPGTPKRDVVILTVKDGAPVLADKFFPTVVAQG